VKIRYLIYLFIIFLFSIYIGFGFIYFNWYTHIISPNKILQNKAAKRIVDIIGHSKFSKAYSFNAPFLSTTSEYKFVFSEKDKLVNDSVINVAMNGKQTFSFRDDLRIWQKASFITPEGIYKIKYKFHGTSLTPYYSGHASFKIKSKHPINGMKSFRLYSMMEGPYIRIFINNLAKKNGLICESIGSYMPVSGYNGTKLYLQSSGFSDDYLRTNYNIENPIRFKSNDEWYHSNRVHVNNLDGIGYAIEWNGDLPLDTVEKSYLDKFIKIRSGDENYLSSRNYKYFGKYLALLYFFGHPHQVTGDNDTWISINNSLLPIYRNEGHIDALNFNKDQLDNLFWDMYYSTKTLTPYKKVLLDDSVRHYRNQLFNKLVLDKDLLINQLDSIFEYWEESLFKYNEAYYKIKKEHQFYKENIEHNINLISNYLQVTELASYIHSDTISVAVDAYVDIEVIINNRLFSVINPRKFSLKEEKIVSTIINHNLYCPEEIEEIIFRNSITKDTISNERLLLIY